MNIPHHKSLGFRLISAFIFIIVIVLAAHALFAVLREQRKVRDELRNKGELLTNLLSYGSRIGVFAENKNLLKDVSAGIVSEPAVVLVEVYNADSELLYVMKKGMMSDQVHREIKEKLPIIRPEGDGITAQETGNLMEFRKPVVLRLYPNEEKSLYFGDKVASTARIIGSVRIVMTKESVNREILRILLQNTIIALIFIAASIAVVYMRVRKITKPLQTLTRHVRILGRGGDVAQVPVETNDETGRLATAFNTMLDERNAARKAFQKILMDIHDGIGGITTNICLLSEIAQKVSTPAELKQALATISELSRDGMGEIRSLMYSLDKNDLTWHTLGGELRSRGTKILEPHAIEFEMTAEIDESSTEPVTLVCLHLFRIYREALMNVIKHSKAKKVSVGFLVKDERLLLIVRDDGQGCDEAALFGKGRGVANMKSRAADMGGAITITSECGTCVSLEMPLSK